MILREYVNTTITEKKTMFWLGVQLDMNIPEPTGKVVLVPFYNEEEASKAEDKFNNFSDHTVFGVDNWGDMPVDDIKKSYKEKTVQILLAPTTVDKVYTLLKEP